MFDKTVLMPHPSRSYVSSNNTMNVNRAPTDESVKLLREMEAIAQKEIEKSIRVKDNSFDMNVSINNNMYNFEYDVIVRYKLNGKDCKTSIIIDMNEEDLRNIASIIVEHLAKDIVINCFEPLSDSLYNVFSKKFR